MKRRVFCHSLHKRAYILLLLLLFLVMFSLVHRDYNVVTIQDFTKKCVLQGTEESFVWVLICMVYLNFGNRLSVLNKNGILPV